MGIIFVQKSSRGSTEVSQSHGRVSTRGHHIYKSTSTPLLGEVLECNIEVVTSRIAMQWQFSAGKRLLGMAKYQQLAHCFSKEPEEFTVRLLEG